MPSLDDMYGLESLMVNDNALTSLPDLSRNTVLEELVVHNTPRTRSYTPPNKNQLTTLPDLSQNTQLRTLLVDDNQLTALPDLTRNTALGILYPDSN